MADEVQYVEPPIYFLREPDGKRWMPDPLTGLPFYTYHYQYAKVVQDHEAQEGVNWQIVTARKDGEAAVKTPWDKDLTGELATNPGPYENSYLKADGGWWQRTLDQIDILTFHHTLSDSPHATAQHYIVKDGGKPTTPYTIWITQTGEVYLCVPLTEGLWHDHTGHQNTHLSVGLAGSLHIHHPADVQLDAAARMAVWAIKSDMLPLITEIGHIKGHRDFIATACPGWSSAQSGNWKLELYNRIEEKLGG